MIGSTLRAQRSPLVPSAGVVGRGSRSRWVCDPHHLLPVAAVMPRFGGDGAPARMYSRRFRFPLSS